MTITKKKGKIVLHTSNMNRKKKVSPKIRKRKKVLVTIHYNLRCYSQNIVNEAT